MKQVLYGLLVITPTSTYALLNAIQEKPTYTCQQAEQSHVEQLLAMINSIGGDDLNNLVVFPKLFREQILRKTIDQHKLFVAIDSEGTILGFKKLFVISNSEELLEIASQEICCIDGIVEQTISYNYQQNRLQELFTTIRKSDYDEHSTYLYLGGDYTVPSARGSGINTLLMIKGMEMLSQEIAESIKVKNSRSIVLLYGVTEANFRRKHSIIRLFVRLLVEHNLIDPTIECELNAFVAYKPTFDPDAQACIPSTDLVRGHGCVLTCPLRNNNQR